LTREGRIDMSAPHSTAWLLAATRRRASYADLRISDAERTEVADLLSRHYEDGRLDQAEFDQRLDQAMKARTYKDLSGLFADLPAAGGPDSPPMPDAPGRLHLGRWNHRVVGLVIVAAIAAVAGHALVWSLTPWVWIALVCMIILLATRGPRNTSLSPGRPAWEKQPRVVGGASRHGGGDARRPGNETPHLVVSASVISLSVRWSGPRRGGTRWPAVNTARRAAARLNPDCLTRAEMVP
jgi:hypothetical protein